MKRSLLSFLIFTTALCFVPEARSETLVLSSGSTVVGTVIRTNGSDLMVLTDYGTFNFGRGSIKEIKGAQAEVSEIRSTNRIADFKSAVVSLSRQKWGADLTQIPATVIEKGMFRNVPYVSFRCSDDYEVNIYGDLKNPAAIEAGVYRKLLGGEAAKLNCINFIKGTLGETADKEILQKLSREKDLKVRNGVSFEITPPTDEDAYQGWWISVFSEKKLNESRASDKELSAISVAKDGKDTSDWSSEDMKLARPSNPEVISFISPSGVVITNAEVVRVVDNAYIIWRREASGGMVRLADLPEDLRARFGYDASKAATIYATDDRKKAQAAQERSVVARTPTAQTRQAQTQSASDNYIGGGYSGYSASASSGGSVYVKGYTRKDGTYVHSYMRRK